MIQSSHNLIVLNTSNNGLFRRSKKKFKFEKDAENKLKPANQKKIILDNTSPSEPTKDNLNEINHTVSKIVNCKIISI
jgi:hypothetical protein